MGTEPNATRTFRSTSPEATEELGERIGALAPPGLVIALSGDLGAGKTCLVRGLARGLGIEETVASPTYVLMQAHEGGRLPLYHFDAWLEGREKALFLDGGDDWLRAGGVAVVEWAERVEPWMPEPRLEIELAHRAIEERLVRLAVVGEPRPGGGPGPLATLLGALGSIAGLLDEPSGDAREPPAAPPVEGGR